MCLPSWILKIFENGGSLTSLDSSSSAVLFSECKVVFLAVYSEHLKPKFVATASYYILPKRVWLSCLSNSILDCWGLL